MPANPASPTPELQFQDRTGGAPRAVDETPPSPWPPLQPATFPAPTDVTPLLKNPSHRGSSIRNRGIAVVAVCLIPGAAFHVFPAAKLETTALPLTPNPAATYDPKHPILCSVRPLTPCQFTPSPRKALLLLGNAPVSHQILLCLPLPYLLLVSTLELAPASARPMALRGAQPLAQPSDPPRATFSTTPLFGNLASKY